MSVRLHFIVEGQTEETFVNRILIPHLANCSVWGKVRCVMTSRKRGVKYRGGLRSYEQAKRDIQLWMKEDQNPDVVFTTMFDLYALPSNFPGYENAHGITDPYGRVSALENAMHKDIGNSRFVPYIQLHEFEALLLADPRKLDWIYLEHDAAIQNLIQMASEFNSPELIDDGDDAAPSKRIIKEIPEYEGMKVSAGPLVAEKIGLSALRSKCRHFDEWIRKLERLRQGIGV
ncbi:MAG: DUF4276 family protein [Candidatus Tectomicrobia bacterium]|uniref:DUF4276 family protein n=1 Tax=Tectimicrobiota bacterium TaxID=2528274 RepID=A0A932GRY9_UNCTE|nr:DUF4276 family protein [Candidatus Tectomicrobia bacterium]